MEAIEIWDPANIDCIVSLGTGPERGHTMDNATLELLGPRGMWLCQKMLSRYYYYRIQLASYSLQAMTGTDEPHQKTKQMVQAFRGVKRLLAASDAVEPDEVYFRLNVTDPEALVDLDAWREMPKLQQLADEYMKTDRVAIQSKEGIVARLAGSRLSEPLPPNHALDVAISFTSTPASQRLAAECSRWLEREPSPFQLDLTIYHHKSARTLRAKGMIDTATQDNLISKRLAQLLEYPLSALRSHETPDLVFSHGPEIKVISTVQLDFRIRAGKIMKSSFLVVDTEVFNVVLGKNFIIDEGFLIVDTDSFDVVIGNNP
jgi:hypothetical protein